MAKHRKRSEWQLLVNQFLQSKDTMYNYCAKNNLNFRTFKNWHYKLKPAVQQNFKLSKNIKISKTIKSEEAKFIKFSILTRTITVRLPNGINLEFMSNNLSTVIKELANAI